MAGSVLSFGQIDRTLLDLAGGKGANLGELSRVGGIRVPEGFCVATDAYREVVARNGEFIALLDELSRLAAGDPHGLRAISSRIREVVETTPIPGGIAEEISSHLDVLGESGAYARALERDRRGPVDGVLRGQQDTYLNVTGKDAVLQHVSKCWASLFTERAVTYRLQQGIDHRSVHLAVIIQRMVFPEVAGIMFTANPITSNRKVTSIDAGFGLGEALVSGLANADNYTVQDSRIVDRRVWAQAVAVRALPGGGTEATEIETGRRGVQKLADAQIVRLAGIGRTIEAHFGCPQDIEWSLADDTFYILQSRPITTVFPIPGVQDGRNHVYMSFGHQQMMTEAMKPLGLSFFQAQLEEAPLTEAGGRFYIDLAPDLASPVGRRVVLASMGKIDPLMDSAIRGLTQRKDFMEGLAQDRQRYFSMNGAGYFSWRLPVEAVKLYRSNDPARVAALRARHNPALEDLQRRLGSLSGDELFESILDDLGRAEGCGDRPTQHGGGLCRVVRAELDQQAHGEVAGRQGHGRHARAVRDQRCHLGDGTGVTGRRRHRPERPGGDGRPAEADRRHLLGRIVGD